MIVLLSKNKKLVKQTKKVDNVKLVDNIYECGVFLEIPDIECDLLVLDYKLISGCNYTAFFEWIIEKNLFIRNILIYYEESNNFTEEFHQAIDKLKEEKYPTHIIHIDKLVEAIKLL